MDKRKEISKILNAFRMGVIPDVALDELIVGRESEKIEINKLLNIINQDDCSSVKFVKGGYGSGKTFMLNYIKQKALEENYVVANISINGGFNLSKLDAFYSNIMCNLSIKTSSITKGTSFEEIFDGWIKNLKNLNDNKSAAKDIYNVIFKLNDYNNAFANVLLIYIRAKINYDYELANIAASWIKGDKNISYELKKQLKVKGSIDKENVMDIFRGFAKLLTLIGYSGLIIEIDEAELIMTNRSDIRMKSYANMRLLIDSCGTNDIEKCGFIFAGTDELFNNQEKGFKSYDALNQRIGEIISGGKKTTPNVRQPVIELNRFTDKEFYTILQKVLTIHETYYNYKTTVSLDTIFNLVMVECVKTAEHKDITIRNYLKKLLEILDLMEEKPNLPIFKTKVKSRVRDFCN